MRRLAPCLCVLLMGVLALGGDAPPPEPPKAPPAKEAPAKEASRELPLEAQALFLEAVQLKLQDKHADAIERFKKVLEFDKDSPAVLFELGFCHYRLGKNKEAMEHLKRSVELDPQNGAAHETLAFVYNALKEGDKALDELEAAAKSAQRPRNHDGLVQRIAWIYERQNDYKNAIKWYRFLLDCGYRSRKAYLSLGTLQLKEKLYDEALGSFREVVRRTQGDDETTLSDVAGAYAQLTEADRTEAIRRCEATAAKSNDPATLEALSLAYQAAGRTDDMLRTIERAASFTSERTGLQKEFLADHFEEAGNLAKAIEWRLKILDGHKAPAAEELVRLAALYVKHEEMERAADTFRKAVAAEPQRTDLLRRVADCYSELYQWDRAAAVLEGLLKGKELGPGDAEAVFDLAEAYREAGKAQQAEERKKQAFDLLTRTIGKAGSRPAEILVHVTLAELYYAAKQPDKALGYLIVAHQFDPDEPKKLLLLAGAHKRVRNWAEAAATLQRYAEKHPKTLATVGALFEAATCLECAGQPAAATAAREQAKKLILDAAEATRADPAKAAVHAQLGEVALQRNQPRPAIEHFLEALRLDPKLAIAHLHLGQCYQMLGDWARAAAHYKSYLDSQTVDEGEARILYRLGVAQTRSGQPDLGTQSKLRAIQLLTDALATLDKEQRGTPTHKAAIHRDLCGFYAGEKDHPKALEAIQKAIALAPSGKRADYRLAHASLLDDLKRYDDGERLLVETHKAEPDNPAVLNHLGYFYAERGKNLDQAVALVQKALLHEPLNGAYLDSLGWAYYQQGKHEEALKLLLRATQYEEDAVIRDHLGDAYHKLGKLHEAREAWARAIVLDPDTEGVAEKLRKTQPKEPPAEKANDQ